MGNSCSSKSIFSSFIGGRYKINQDVGIDRYDDIEEAAIFAFSGVDPANDNYSA